MISRSDWEPLPTPTLSLFLHPGTFLCVGFHCRCVVCARLRYNVPKWVRSVVRWDH